MYYRDIILLKRKKDIALKLIDEDRVNYIANADYLVQLSDNEGYETYVVPDDIGGRFSVTTAVGLLPIAAAGIDIDEMMKGAADARVKYQKKDLYHLNI